MFRRIQNSHISQTQLRSKAKSYMFRRIQNLHISQTKTNLKINYQGFVEFKIYISLKLENNLE